MTQGALAAPQRLGQRMAAGSRPAAFALGFAPIVLVGMRSGGYYAGAWSWAGVGLCAAAVLSLTLGERPALSRIEVLAVGALTALCAWMLLSAAWGIAGSEPEREASRCALYALALSATVVVVRRQRTKALLTGVLAGSVTLSGIALVERALIPPPTDPYQGTLLVGTVGYANALGIVAAMGLLLAVGLLLDRPGRRERDALAATCLVSGAALALTSSRGAWLATVVGLGVLVALRHGRTLRLVVIGAALATTIALTAALIHSPRTTLGDRSAYWSVALTEAAQRPVLGSGAGSFDDSWREHRPIPASVRDAHSAYLEVAAELGVVGLVLLLLALGAPLAAAARARDRGVAATAAAAYVAFLVHAGLDWDWEMPVTTFAGLACGAALLAGGRSLSRS